MNQYFGIYICIQMCVLVYTIFTDVLMFVCEGGPEVSECVNVCV